MTNTTKVFLAVFLFALVGGAVYWARFRKTESGPAKAPTTDLPKVPELKETVEVEPGYKAPPTTDLALAPMVNRRFRTEERLRPDITSSVAVIKYPEDVKVMVGVLKDTKDTDDVRNETINLLRRSKYAGLTADLLDILNNPAEKERFRGFVAQHLGIQADMVQPDERAKIIGVLQNALSDRDLSVRREALLALVRMLDPKGLETAVSILNDKGDESAPMRDLAVRCIRDQNLREHLPRLRELASDPNEAVQIAALVTLSEWGDSQSKPLFEKAAHSESLRLKRAGEAALNRLVAASKTVSEKP